MRVLLSPFFEVRIEVVCEREVYLSVGVEAEKDDGDVFAWVVGIGVWENEQLGFNFGKLHVCSLAQVEAKKHNDWLYKNQFYNLKK